GGGDPVGDRAVPGLADHADPAGAPVGHGGRAVRVVRPRPAVQPVDDRLGGLHLLGAADVLAAGGAVGAGQVHRDEGVPARHEVVVVEQRLLGDGAARVVRLDLALVAPPAALVVRRSLHDDGYPHVCGGRL